MIQINESDLREILYNSIGNILFTNTEETGTWIEFSTQKYVTEIVDKLKNFSKESETVTP